MLSRIRFFVLVASWLAGFLSPSFAQSVTPTPSPVQMVISSPFAKTTQPLLIAGRSGKWVPVAVSLSNTGAPVSGQVQLQLAPNQGTFEYAPNSFTASVDLPTNSSKRIWMYARLDRPDVGGFDVSFSGRGFPSLARRVPVVQPDPEQRQVMVVSDSDIGLSGTLRSLRAQMFISNGRMPTNSSGSGSTPVLPFSFGKEMVPDRWIGFESADMVVLGDFPHIGLSPTQIEALRGYVQGGGTLVVLGGANAARLSSSPLKDLWPIVPTNSVAAPSGEVAGLVSEFVGKPRNGGDRLGGAPVVVTRGTLSPDALPHGGTVIHPAWAERQTGAGRVLFLSFDPSQPPFKGWSGQGRLWRDLLNQSSKINTIQTVDADFLGSSYSNFSSGGYSAPPPSYLDDENSAPSTLTGQLLASLSHAQQLTMPPVSRIAWFLALYVFFLVPLNYAVLRLLDRRELAWITIPVIVTVFSMWAYTEALSIRGRAILTRQMDVVQSSIDSKQGRVDSLFWLFSPRRTTYDISSAGQNAALCDYANKAGGEQGNFSVSQPLDGGSFQIQGAPLRMWTDRAFASQSLGDLKQGLTLSGRTLRNGVGVDLFGAVWVQDERVTGLGQIKNGASVLLVPSTKGQTFGADISGAIVRASKLNAVFDESSRANGIPQAALSAALGEGLGKSNPGSMLLAWGRQSVAPFAIGADNGQGRQMTLFIFRAPKLPAELAARDATVQAVSLEPFSPGQNPSQGGYRLFDCQLLTSRPFTIHARGTAAFFPGARSYSPPGRFSTPPTFAGRTPLEQMVRFEAWNVRTSSWQLVKGTMRKDSSPAGGWSFSAPVLPNWIRLPDNLMRVRVRLANSSIQVSSLKVQS